MAAGCQLDVRWCAGPAPVSPHPVSRVLALATSSCDAGVTSSMPMEKPALPMKRALRGGTGRDAKLFGRACAGSGTLQVRHAACKVAGACCTGSPVSGCRSLYPAPGQPGRCEPSSPHLSLARRFMHSAATRGL